jgi:hypothetical protein
MSKKTSNPAMKNTVLHLMLLAFAMPAVATAATLHHSSDFGWTEQEDITHKFAGLFSDGTLKAGDELALDHTYRISGTHPLPDHFTLSAVKGGGFQVIDATITTTKPFLVLGDRNTLRNLTITYLDTPPLRSSGGAGAKRGVDFSSKTGIAASGKSDLRIENCRLLGSISSHLRLADCRRPHVTGCHILGGYWTVYLLGDVTDAVFRHTVFEKCQGDGIKTVRGGSGTQRALVEHCVFQDNGRDGIDTTGGFKDSVVRHCIFRRLFSGLDIKNSIDEPADLTSGVRNTGIVIEHCRFTDMANAVTFSTNDRGFVKHGKYVLNATNAPEHAPHDIDINDCIFERTGDAPVRMLLLKGGHTVRYRNARFFGDGIEAVKHVNVYETFGPNFVSREVAAVLNYGVTGTLGAPGSPAAPGDVSVPFPCGPR